MILCGPVYLNALQQLILTILINNVYLAYFLVDNVIIKIIVNLVCLDITCNLTFVFFLALQLILLNLPLIYV